MMIWIPLANLVVTQVNLQTVPSGLGQVFTPCEIADQIVAELSPLVGQWEGAIVLDPCIGQAALPKALLRAGVRDFTLKACELDSKLADSSDAWIADNLAGSAPVIRGDFLDLDKDILGSWDVAIANPPYIRQEWIEHKAHYQTLAKLRNNVLIPGAANLYVYFIVKLISGLRDEGAFAVIVYDSWSHTRYGRWLVDFLNAHCDELRSIPVRDTPFDGHLIDATILVGRRSHRPSNTMSLEVKDRSTHFKLPGFVPLHSEYWTKRGLRLKQASFFMGTENDILEHGATTFVKKPSKLNGMSVRSNHAESALLLPLKGPIDERVLAEIQRRIEQALNNPEKNQSVLNWFQKRPESWSCHPPAPQAPILFNYYFRSRPRHIYNPHEFNYADNYYGVRPINGLPKAAAFAILNATSTVVELQACSRRQGNGLQKLQLFEYREAWIPGATLFTADQIDQLDRLGQELASGATMNNELVAQIDHVIYQAAGYCVELEPSRLADQANLFWCSE
jgi:adenine-specific DNA-methyltransferase